MRVRPAAVRRCLSLVPLFLFLVLAAAGCAGEQYPQSVLEPKGDFARMVDELFSTTVKWALLVFVLVEGALVYAIFRFRGKPGDGEPEQVHGNTVVEILWTIIPAVVLAMIAVPTVKTIFRTYERPSEDALQVEVVGHQWWWEFRYPTLGLTTANELYVPVGQTVTLSMGTTDVLHSFWVPQFAGKRDVFPNRPTSLWFKAEVPGNYPGQCAEFCGLQHGKMAFRVVAATPEDFEAWVKRMQATGTPAKPAAPAPGAAPADSAVTRTTTQAARVSLQGPAAPADSAAGQAAAAPSDSLAAEGEKLFATRGCAGCHSLSAVNAPKGLIGPNLANIGQRSHIAAGTLPNTPENLARWIRDPQSIKEGVLMPNLGLTEAQAQAIAAYLRRK